MTRRLIAGIALAMLWATTANAGEIYMDSASQDRDGNPLAAAFVRLHVDNSDGVDNLAVERFAVTIHNGPDIGFLSVDFIANAQAGNPWRHGSLPERFDAGGIRYGVGMIYYPDNESNRALGRASSVSPYFSRVLLPEHPDYSADDELANYLSPLVGEVPPGVVWDIVQRWYDASGETVPQLFASPSEGSLLVDEEIVLLSDDDPRPQTAAVPEPASLALLAAGGMALLVTRKRKRKGGTPATRAS